MKSSLLALVAVSSLLYAPSLQAKTTVVGVGTPVSCTEPVLRDALLNPPGGIVSFNCGPQMATITLTMSIAITSDTTIDGGRIAT